MGVSPVREHAEVICQAMLRGKQHAVVTRSHAAIHISHRTVIGSPGWIEQRELAARGGVVALVYGTRAGGRQSILSGGACSGNIDFGIQLRAGPQVSGVIPNMEPESSHLPSWRWMVRFQVLTCGFFRLGSENA